jgi:hypothetical protein
MGQSRITTYLVDWPSNGAQGGWGGQKTASRISRGDLPRAATGAMTDRSTIKYGSRRFVSEPVAKRESEIICGYAGLTRLHDQSRRVCRTISKSLNQ